MVFINAVRFHIEASDKLTKVKNNFNNAIVEIVYVIITVRRLFILMCFQLLILEFDQDVSLNFLGLRYFC